MCLEALGTVWKDNHCLLQQTTNAILLAELSFVPQHKCECDEPPCIGTLKRVYMTKSV
ncbi:hypothetical protein DPMN_096886 [Dreissena polymorpha]|uniref:Uncharacterized protein n=1 Tax=Dreissena polymorpha TaxID=45954 RepID=A0A9D4L9J8_DREPO|nr:hypothetical protein DPMN_096886 [Dreissena polymorpha]